jgi:hypothetical protein
MLWIAHISYIWCEWMAGLEGYSHLRVISVKAVYQYVLRLHLLPFVISFPMLYWHCLNGGLVIR